MKQKILVGKGFSLYDVLRRATDEICHGFIHLGFSVEIVDFKQPDVCPHFHNCLQNIDNYLFYFSMQALYWDKEKREYPQLQNINRIGWIVDDPIFHDERLCGTIGIHANVLTVRDSHVNLIQRDYPHINHVACLYHGGFVCSHMMPYHQRKINVFFPGTFTPLSEVEQELNQLDGIYRQIALTLKDRISGKCLSHSWRNELKKYFSDLQFDISEEEFHALEYVMRPLDLYQRAFMRTRIIEILLENNIDVSVAGMGWDKYTGKGTEHLHILSHSGLNIDETIELMGNSKIVLNNTNIMDGLHERMLSTMLAGAVCVTNEYDLLNNFFQNNNDLVTFSLNQLEVLPNIINDLLCNQKKAEQIAQNGYQAASRSHTWERRGEQIATWVLNNQPFTY